MNEANDIQNYILDALAIGDDEGGKAFAMMGGEQGKGVTDFISDTDRNDAVFIAASIRHCCCRALGWRDVRLGMMEDYI